MSEGRKAAAKFLLGLACGHGPTGPTESASKPRDENSQLHLLIVPTHSRRQ